MFSDIDDDKPLYIQIRDYIKQIILKGLLSQVKITFHQSCIPCRNTIILAYGIWR